MKTKKIFLLLLIIALPFAAYGVLKERDLQTTLKVLRVELQKAYNDQQVLIKRLEVMTTAQHPELVHIMERSSPIVNSTRSACHTTVSLSALIQK